MRFVFTLILLSLVFFLHSQPQLNWGKLQQNINEGSDHVWVVAEDSNSIFVVKRNVGFKAKVFLYLECVNKKTKSAVFSIELLEPHNERDQKMHFDKLIMIESNLYLLSSLFEKDNQNRFSCYATPINKSNGAYGKAYLIYRTTITKTDDPSFTYCLSPDAKKLLIIPVPYDSETNSFKIINRHLSGVVESSISNTKSLFLREFEAICDDSNNVCLYTYHKVYAPLKPFGQITEFENGNLILYKSKADSSINVRVKTPNNITIYDSKLKCINGKTYFFAALHPAYMERTAGILSATIDLEKQDVIEANTTYLNRKQLDEISGLSRGWKDSLGTYILEEVFVNKQNEIYLITEQRYRTYGFFPNSSYNQYLTQGVFSVSSVVLYGSRYTSVFKLQSNGNIDWVKMIPKAQSHVVPQYLSYAVVFKNDKLFFVYNDYLRNQNTKLFYGPATMTNHKKTIGVLTTISGDGSVMTKPIYLPKTNEKLILKPLISSSNYNTLFILGSKHNLFKWATLDIPSQE